MPNMVAGMDTTPPKDVEKTIENLLDDYNLLARVSFNDILRFHVNFEKIHPFQDGNGRVGRLIMVERMFEKWFLWYLRTGDGK